MQFTDWCNLITAIGGIGAVATPFVLWWMQNRSADAQAKFAQKLTTESLLLQNEHAHSLEARAISRKEAREAFVAINRHTQHYTYRFARAHPSEIPQVLVNEAMCAFMPDSRVADFRKAELVDMVAELNADVLMLGLTFGKEKSEHTGSMIRELVRTSRFILDASFASELKSVREHNEENSRLVQAINQSVKPLWDSLL